MLPQVRYEGDSSLLVTSVPDKEANIVIPRKFDGLRDILSRGDLNGVADIVSQLARGSTIGERVAGLVCEIGLHDRG